MENNTQKGRSMIEMLGVLAIVGVLSVGGIMAYNMAMTKFKTTKQIDQVQLLMTNVKTLFASSSNYTGLNNGVLVNLGLLTAATDGAVAGASDAIPVDNAFGGAFDVRVNAAYTGTLGTALQNGSYTIFVNRIPRSACASIANTDWGDADSGLIDFAISTTADPSSITGTLGTAVYNADGTKLSIAGIADECKDNAVMTWVVK